MIYKRSIFLFAWIISSILISSETCSAKAINQMSRHRLSKHVYLVRTVDIAQFNRAVSQNYADRNSIVQQSEPQEEEEQKEILSKHWTGIGIVVTSIFFCLLLWILFQPNLKIKTITTLVDHNDDEQDNEINLPNELQVDFEGEVSLPPPFPLKEDQKSSDERSVIQQAHLVRDKQHDLNLTISEDIQDITAKHTSIIETENQELAQMTTSTDIDMVFELIQDLNNSDRQSRRRAIWKLAKTGDSRSIEPLIDTIPLVDSLDKSLILSAISQIAHRNFEPIYDILFASLKDANSEVRKDAIRDITVLHESTAKINRHLHIMLEDSEEEVRKTAKWALKRVNLGSITSA